MSSTEVSKNFKRTNPGVLDGLYGPYPNLAAACAAVPNTEKLVDGVMVNFREGQVVGIKTIGGIVDYWWQKIFTNDGLVKKLDLSPLEASISERIPVSEKGKPLGTATLNENGTIPLSQLSITTLNYKGVYDAISNFPPLSDGIGNAKDMYLVSVTGSQDFGSGSISLFKDDQVIYNGYKWEKLQNTDVTFSNESFDI